MFSQSDIDIDSVCYRSIMRIKSYEVALQILNDWSRDDDYEVETLFLYVRDKYPEIWAEVLPELIKHRLLR